MILFWYKNAFLMFIITIVIICNVTALYENDIWMMGMKRIQYYRILCLFIFIIVWNLYMTHFLYIPLSIYQTAYCCIRAVMVHKESNTYYILYHICFTYSQFISLLLLSMPFKRINWPMVYRVKKSVFNPLVK